MREAQVKLLFVCMGNICRSPAAHGVMEQMVATAGLSSAITVDSAGTLGYHQGSIPDSRMRASAARRGYALDHCARQVLTEDFLKFDYILAMDEHNFDYLRRISPRGGVAKLEMFLDVLGDPLCREVPDPYYGGDDGFETVLDLVERACSALLERFTADRHKR